MSWSTIWESLKAYLWGQIISYCANKKKTSTARLKELTDQILELDTLYSHQPPADIMKKRLSLRTEFDILSTRQAEYLLSKSQHRCYEHGEKIGQVLAHQLQQRIANQTVPAINDEQGLKSIDSLKINSCFQNFYQSLYTTELSTTPAAMEDFLRSLHVPSVDPSIADTLEKDLSALEIISAIRSMQSGKSPGPDGYPTDFFQKILRPTCPFTTVSF